MVDKNLFKKFISFYNLDLKYKDYSLDNNNSINKYINNKKYYYFYILTLLKELAPNNYNLINYNVVKKKFSTSNIVKKSQYSLIIYITLTSKSFKVNICNSQGLILKKFTSGLLGHKKSDRKAFFSLKNVLNESLLFLNDLSDARILICTKGLNKNKNFVINHFFRSSIRNRVKGLLDLSSLPFNGCRLPSAPRS